MKTFRCVTLVTAVSLLTACTSLPTDSDPVALRTLDSGMHAADMSPTPSLQPDLLAREFYTANAVPTQRYNYARAYLTPEASESWNPAGDIAVLDRIDVSFLEARQAQRLYKIVGTIVGQVRANGVFDVTHEPYETVLTLEQVDGEWRIAQLPDDIVVDRSSFRTQYQPCSLYYFDRDAARLVADRRWIFDYGDRKESELASLVLQGPNEVLAPALDFDLPADAHFVGISDGIYRFTGLTSLNSVHTNRLAAQIVWTLASSGASGPFVLDFDGGHVPSPIDGDDELTAEDFIEYDPKDEHNYSASVYALNDGTVLRRRGDTFGPAFENAKIPGRVQSMSLASEQNRSVVVSEQEDGDHLYGITSDAIVRELLVADKISKPSYESNGMAVWTVVDGNQIMRVSRAEGQLEATISPVKIVGQEPDAPEITALALSPSQVQVAFIQDGRIYVGTVIQPTTDAYEIVNVQELAPGSEERATALTWQTDVTLIIGTENQDAPVWVLASDGSVATTLTNNNVVAPVVSVAASSDMIYITDSRAALELPASSHSTNAFWREVSGLEGTDSVVIVD